MAESKVLQHSREGFRKQERDSITASVAIRENDRPGE